MSVDKRNPWDRLPKETDKAWAAFQVYIDLPKPDRAYRLVADKLGLHMSQIAMWGRKYKWVSRVAAWDNAQLGVISPEERDEALGAYQLTVIADSHDDYTRLRDLWRRMLEELDSSDEPSAADLKSLIQSRNQLDVMARRTARMPTSFKALEKDGLADVEKKQFYLDADNGPMEIEGVIE